MDSSQTQSQNLTFTTYQKFMVAILSFIQFTVILDFMVLSPLGAILIKELNLTPPQFGLVVSAYAFSAGASGLLAAGFADKYDRKSFLLFFYAGFLIGTLCCAISTNYEFLLVARILTGIFGGVIGSIGFAITSDIFPVELRGRVMAYGQSAFSASQVLGLPISLYLANKFDWHAPFYMIVGIGALVGVIIFLKMKPITEHLKLQKDNNALQHLGATIANPFYFRAFLATVLLATAGFMMMPFGTAYSTNNLGLAMDDLPMMYAITGVSAIIFAPFLGKLVDTIGSFKLFMAGTILAMLTILYYTQLGKTPFWTITFISIILWAGISSRMISSGKLLSVIPDAKDRGAFMSLSSSIQQVSGGVAAFIAGQIVMQQADGNLAHYDRLGYTVCGSMLVAVLLVYGLDKAVKQKNPNIKV
jgi:predicted MFS family arabinose efflux permease